MYICKYGHKILVIATIVVAVALAVLVSTWHDQGVNYVIFISKLFDIMLPVLAIGALLKYLFTCPHTSCDCPSCRGECTCNTQTQTASPEKKTRGRKKSA